MPNKHFASALAAASAAPTVMETRMHRLASLSLIALLAAAPALAKPIAAHPPAEAQAEALAKELIAVRSVRGPDNRTAQAQALIQRDLLAGGWQATQVTVTPANATAYLLATWPGRDPALKPLVILGHIDVVEAKPADWQRDPFTPVVENGMLYGRGAVDMKYSAALAVASLVELRKQGFVPQRSIVLALTGDEETAMHNGSAISDAYADAFMVLNIDGTGGPFDEKSGQPLFWSWDGSEKTYSDFKIEVTNPGGHSSAPRADNAIVQLATALTRIGAYKFSAEQNDLTRTYWAKAAQFEGDAKLAAAMRTFAANPQDEAAIATLRASPSYVGKVGTTCVPTLIAGGHAENALPQRASANINCRIFPGRKPADIMAELQRVAAVPQAAFSDVTEGSVATAASPVRADFTAATATAIAASWPGVPIIPNQSSGASDSMWFRAHGVPAYGVSPIMIKDSDEYAHGLNERVPLSNTRPGIDFYLSLFASLSK